MAQAVPPHRRKKDGGPEVPTKPELDMIVNQPEVLAERRRRLSDVSWWMRCMAENIARRANREDECTGRFWEGRFKLQNLLDEASLLACAAYVDLNPIRAALAETPETSDCTGAKDRIDNLNERTDRTRPSTHNWERSRRRKRSSWMSPIEIDEQRDPTGPCLDNSSRRASSKGFVSISMARFLELLDWTGRQLRADKVGKIPDHLAPILSRIGLDGHGWCDVCGSSVGSSSGPLEHRSISQQKRSAAAKAGSASRRTRSASARPECNPVFRFQQNDSGCLLRTGSANSDCARGKRPCSRLASSFTSSSASGSTF